MIRINKLVLKDAAGKEVVRVEGDHLIFQNPTVDTTISYTYDSAKAGNFRLDQWTEAEDKFSKTQAYDVIITSGDKELLRAVNANEMSINDEYNNLTFDLDEDAPVTISFVLKASESETKTEIAAPKIVGEGGQLKGKNDEINIVKLMDVNDNIFKKSLSEYAANDITIISNGWEVSQYDNKDLNNPAISPSDDGQGDDADQTVTFTVKVNKNTEYDISFGNEKSRAEITIDGIDTVQNDNGDNSKVHFNSGDAEEITFTIKKKASATDGYVKVYNLNVAPNGHAKRSSFDDAKSKIGDFGYDTDAAKADLLEKLNNFDLSKITTADEYAYYILNTFWYENAKGATAVIPAYDSMTLKDAGDGTFIIGNKNGGFDFDADSKSIVATTGKDENGFFPADGYSLMGDAELSEVDNDPEGPKHNFHYAMKSDSYFQWTEGQRLEFDFSGDDDVYVFINGEKALDLGGAHLEYRGKIVIDETGNVKQGTAQGTLEQGGTDIPDEDLADTGIKLTSGDHNGLQFFYMERHTTASNLNIATSIALNEANVKADVSLSNGKNEIGPDDAVSKDDTVYVNYSLTSQNDNLKKAKFTDTDSKHGTTEFSYDEESKTGTITLRDDVEIDGNLVFTKIDTDGNSVEIGRISSEDYNNPEKAEEVNRLMEEVHNTELKTGESIKVTGVKLKKNTATYKSNLTTNLTGTVNKYNFESGSFEPFDNEAKNTDEITVMRSYDVTYKFVDTYGKEITVEEINDKKPENQLSVVTGTKVVAESPEAGTEVSVEGGKWVFIGWDETRQEIVDKDVKFTGTWKFVEDKKETPETPSKPSVDKPSTPNNNTAVDNVGKTSDTTKANTSSSATAKAPKTGDSTPIALYVTLLAAALATLVALLFRHRRAK